MAPESITGKRISFYTNIVSSSARDAELRHKEYTLDFNENGTYVGHLKGDSKFDRGDYSYHRVEKKNEARLILIYSYSNNSYTYAHILTFQTPNSGTWIKEKSDDPESTQQESGTFRIVSSQ